MTTKIEQALRELIAVLDNVDPEFWSLDLELRLKIESARAALAAMSEPAKVEGVCPECERRVANELAADRALIHHYEDAGYEELGARLGS